MKSRESNVELLRIILLLSICFWHVIVHGYGFAHMKALGVPTNAVLLDAFASFLSPAVDTFVLISGFFGIHFSYKGLFKLVFQAFLYSVFIYIIMAVITDEFYISKFFHSLLPITFMKWWFLTVYVLLFILSPLINKGIRSLSDCQLQCLLLFFFIINSFGNLGGSNFQSLLFLYLFGSYLARLENIRKWQWSKKKCLWLYIACSIILFIISASKLYSHHPSKAMNILSYNNPIIIVQAVCIFRFFRQLQLGSLYYINYCARYVFAVYLITEAIDKPLYYWQKEMFERNAIWGIVSVMCAFAICIIIDIGREKLYNIFLERTRLNKLLEKPF